MTVFIKNKKVYLNFETLEEFEAGIELLGFEVKSIRGNRGSLEGSYVIVRGNEAYLINSHIPPYQAQNTPKEYDPYRNRKLLLTKKELRKLHGLEKQKGLTLVPISVYSLGRKIKIKFAVAKGKKKYDKREDLKKKEAKRHIDREIKNKTWG